MISFRLNIALPLFMQKNCNSVDYVMFDKLLTKHKAFEIQFSKFNRSELFELRFDTNLRGEDHAGPQLQLTILEYYFGIQLYDTRHWNYDEKRWYRSDEDPFA